MCTKASCNLASTSTHYYLPLKFIVYDDQLKNVVFPNYPIVYACKILTECMDALITKILLTKILMLD